MLRYWVVFDTDSTFYYVNRYNRMVSKQQTIESKCDFYEHYKVEYIGGDKISIYFWYYSNNEYLQFKERTLIYLIENDFLIQDLDKLIEKK